MQQVKREIEVFKLIPSHENVIKFEESYEDEKCFYIVMEFIPDSVELSAMI